MSKVKLLLDVVQDVRALADSLQAVADFIQLGTACAGGNACTAG